MKLPPYVKPFPFPLSHIGYRGLAFSNRIYLRKAIYEDLISKYPKIENIGILIHEEEHVKRIKKVGAWKFGLKFWLNRNFRFSEEIVANKTQFAYLKKYGGRFDMEKRARQLSGPPYLWCVSYEKAKKELRRVWEEA